MKFFKVIFSYTYKEIFLLIYYFSINISRLYSHKNTGHKTDKGPTTPIKSINVNISFR